jgi:hypothetical protein
VLGGTPGAQRRLSTRQDLLHTLVHAHERVVRNLADRPSALRLYSLESHRWLLSGPSGCGIAERKGSSSRRLLEV